MLACNSMYTLVTRISFYNHLSEVYHENNYFMLHRTRWTISIKKENDINEGKWIGVGGHAENGESPEECLLREVKEETGLTLTSYRFRALITFISDKQEPELMCLFTADEFSGKLITCNEGDLKWVDKTIVPTLPTWEGDAIFLKLLLENEENFFTLKLVYEGESLVDQKLEIY
jgi:8-oxo-dGTP diphosphatase